MRRVREEIILDIGGEGSFHTRPTLSAKPAHPRWGKAIWFTLNIEADKEPDIVDDAVALARVCDGSVDGIYSSHTIEHIDPSQSHYMFSNWHRALKPGGRLEIRCPDVEWAWREYFAGRLPEALLTELMVGIRTGPYEVHRNMWWPSKLVGELEECGFVKARQINYGFVLPYIDFWPYDGKYTEYHGFHVVDLLVEAYKPPVNDEVRKRPLKPKPVQLAGSPGSAHRGLLAQRVLGRARYAWNSVQMRMRHRTAVHLLSQIMVAGD